MVNTLTVPTFTNLLADGVNWQIVGTDTPGGCKAVPWCEGLCDDLQPGYLGTDHGRDIGSAMRGDDLLMEISVMQWKAAPGKTWRDGASGGGSPNRDRAPKVSIYAYPPDGPSQALFLDSPWGRSLVTALRLVDCAPFADMLDAAETFAKRLDEESKR